MPKETSRAGVREKREQASEIRGPDPRNFVSDFRNYGKGENHGAEPHVSDNQQFTSLQFTILHLYKSDTQAAKHLASLMVPLCEKPKIQQPDKKLDIKE